MMSLGVTVEIYSGVSASVSLSSVVLCCVYVCKKIPNNKSLNMSPNLTTLYNKDSHGSYKVYLPT